MMWSNFINLSIIMLFYSISECRAFSINSGRTKTTTTQCFATNPIEIEIENESTQKKTPSTFVIIGGTGRIGTAIASHILLRNPSSQIILVGRDENRGMEAVNEVIAEHAQSSTSDNNSNNNSNNNNNNNSNNNSNNMSLFDHDQVIFKQSDWKNDKDLKDIVSYADCLIHTAGPFLEEEPKPLKEAIASDRCRAYVDVSDPLDFLDESLKMDSIAKEDSGSGSGTTALLAAGAFPGMSNVLAMEAAGKLNDDDRVRDVRFNYFTAGLGGSGDVNLYITNLGFGEPMVQYENGVLRFYKALSGLLLGKVDFFLEEVASTTSNTDTTTTTTAQYGNSNAKQRIGTKTVFSWPFPEAATVARELGISGQSSAAMGTAPDVWNTMLGILVALIPRGLWKSTTFSKFLADFSQPLVKVTDILLRLTSPDKVGETHAIRVDVTGESGDAVSCVQAHESFRRCVGQSCAEFALDLLEHPSPGVQLPEQRYRDETARTRIINCLTTTPGTFTYTGAISVDMAPAPTNLGEALNKANAAETTL